MGSWQAIEQWSGKEPIAQLSSCPTASHNRRRTGSQRQDGRRADMADLQAERVSRIVRLRGGGVLGCRPTSNSNSAVSWEGEAPAEPWPGPRDRKRVVQGRERDVIRG